MFDLPSLLCISLVHIVTAFGFSWLPTWKQLQKYWDNQTTKDAVIYPAFQDFGFLQSLYDEIWLAINLHYSLNFFNFENVNDLIDCTKWGNIFCQAKKYCPQTKVQKFG